MALLYPVDEPYARLVPELLDAAGDRPGTAHRLSGWRTPWSDGCSRASSTSRRPGSPATASPPGLPRARSSTGTAAASRVRAGTCVSRAAGVVGGSGQWLERLGHHADELERQRSRPPAPTMTNRTGGSLSSNATSSRRARLRAFVEELVRVAAPPASSTWAGVQRMGVAAARPVCRRGRTAPRLARAGSRRGPPRRRRARRAGGARRRRQRGRPEPVPRRVGERARRTRTSRRPLRHRRVRRAARTRRSARRSRS